MSVFRTGNERNAKDVHASAEDEALSRLSDDYFYPELPDDFERGGFSYIREVIFPAALERGDVKVARGCDVMLEGRGYGRPNRLTGRWEPLTKPHNEVQVREMFAHKMPTFGYRIVRSREGFPDWLLLTDSGDYVRAEVELRSSSFLTHGHSVKDCDLVVCWVHDCGRLELPVLELHSGRKWGVAMGMKHPAFKSRSNMKLYETPEASKRVSVGTIRQRIAENVQRCIDGGMSNSAAIAQTAKEFDVTEAVVTEHWSRFKA